MVSMHVKNIKRTKRKNQSPTMSSIYNALGIFEFFTTLTHVVNTSPLNTQRTNSAPAVTPSLTIAITSYTGINVLSDDAFHFVYVRQSLMVLFPSLFRTTIVAVVFLCVISAQSLYKSVVHRSHKLSFKKIHIRPAYTLYIIQSLLTYEYQSCM